jgi:hypothetical protein
MKKFLALYKISASSVERMKGATKEDMKTSMDAWMKWMQDHKDAIVEMGAPLGATKSITPAGEIVDTHNDLGAYSVVQAESADEAAQIFVGHPHFAMAGDESSIEIVECLPLPGM